MSHTGENGFLLHRDGAVFYHSSVLCRGRPAREVGVVNATPPWVVGEGRWAESVPAFPQHCGWSEGAGTGLLGNDPKSLTSWEETEQVISRRAKRSPTAPLGDISGGNPASQPGLVESLTFSHQPTWDDCQQLLQVLFTTEEKERILLEARENVPRANGAPTNLPNEIDAGFPLN